MFRRSFSALVLAECIARDNEQLLLPARQAARVGRPVATWYLRERDLRGCVPGKGWAHAIAHGADAIGVLARSPHFGRHELTVLLDVLADRLLRRSTRRLRSGEPDRMAAATMPVLRRNLVPLESSSPGSPGSPPAPSSPRRRRPTRSCGTGNAAGLPARAAPPAALAPHPPPVRPDLLLVLATRCELDATRRTSA